MAQLPENERSRANTPEAPITPLSTLDLSALFPYLSNIPSLRSLRSLSTAPQKPKEPAAPTPPKQEPPQQAQQSELLPPFLRGLPLLGLNLNSLLPQPNGQEPAKSATPEPPKPPVVINRPLPLQHPLSPDPRRMPPPPHLIPPRSPEEAIRRNGWAPTSGIMGGPRGWVWGNSPESMNAGPMTPRVYRHDDLNAPMGALREAAPGSISPGGIRIGSPWSSNWGGR